MLKIPLKAQGITAPISNTANNICAKFEAMCKAVLLIAAKRYMKCLADRFQLKIREGKTKRKKPPHF